MLYSVWMVALRKQLPQMLWLHLIPTLEAGIQKFSKRGGERETANLLVQVLTDSGLLYLLKLPRGEGERTHSGTRLPDCYIWHFIRNTARYAWLHLKLDRFISWLIIPKQNKLEGQFLSSKLTLIFFVDPEQTFQLVFRKHTWLSYRLLKIWPWTWTL